MNVKVYMQDWFYNAGITGFINILKHVDCDTTVKKENYIEFDTKILKDFHKYYFQYFFDKYNVAENFEKRVTESFNRIKSYMNTEVIDKEDVKKNKEKIKNEKKYIKEVIKKLLDKIKKIDEYIYNNMNEKYVQIDSINEKQDIEKLDEIAKCLIENAKNENVNKKNTTNLFKNVLSKSYFGQQSFLNVVMNSLSYEQQMQRMYEDYLQDIIETDFFNDILQQKYTQRQLLECIDTKIEQTKKDINKIYCKIKKMLEKNKTIEDIKLYLETSVLENCSLCGEKQMMVNNYSEGSFIPLGISNDNARNFFWNQVTNFPICSLCKLILLCIPAGTTLITKTYKEDSKYKEKNILSFVNYDTSINNLVKVNNNFADKSRRENAKNNPYESIVLDILEQDKKINAWQLQNIFVIEFDTEYGAYSRLEYFNIKKYIAKFLIKYSDKTLNSILDYRYKLQIIDYMMKNKDISSIINSRLLEEYKSDKKIKSGYNSFLATQTRLNLNLLKKEDLNVDSVIDKNNKKLYAIYSTGIEIHETLKHKGEENKLNGFTYKMLNSIKLGNKKDFMDSVIRIHMFMGKNVSPIFLEVMQDTDLDFESIGHAFVSGLISNKFDNKGENKDEQ